MQYNNEAIVGNNPSQKPEELQPSLAYETLSPLPFAPTPLPAPTTLQALSPPKLSVIDADGMVGRSIPSHIVYAASIARTGAASQIQEYNAGKERFENALKLWAPRYAAALKNTLEATRFIDWAHMARDLLEVLLSRGEDSVLTRKLAQLYNRNGGAKDPEFTNVQRVNDFLKNTSEPSSLKRLLDVHSIAMAKSVEGLRKAELGKIRGYSVYGVEDALTKTQIQRLIRNPYLAVKIEGKRPGEFKLYKDVTYKCEITYPEPVGVSSEALSRIENSHRDTCSAVRAFQALPLVDQEWHRDACSREYTNLTRDLLTALAEERYTYFTAELRKFQALSSSKEVLGYIKCVAYHYRDMISIHPLGDGNGRSIRYESLYDPLDKAGIARPRLLDVNADYLSSLSEWNTEVLRGILSTDALYRDITHRILTGMRIENSPELIFPSMVRDVGIELRTYGRKSTAKNISLYQVHGPQFLAFVHTRISQEPKLASRFSEHDAVTTARTLREEYKEFIKRTVIIAKVPGELAAPTGLHLVDFDFASSFGIQVSHDNPAWQNKMSRWYTDTPIWRGMAHTDPTSTEELLGVFREMSWLTLSNNTAGKYAAPKKSLRRAILKEFDRYNSDLVTNTLYKTVVEHVEEGEGYGTSYGLSTSRKLEFAAGFAWGRGTFGYDNKEVAAAQHMIKSRILIGAYRAIKDIDVRRFKMLDPRFSYKFPRQQEVFAVGGIDPDAVFALYELDHTRKIVRSFLRNPDAPNQVAEYNGNVKTFALDSPKLERLHQI